MTSEKHTAERTSDVGSVLRPEARPLQWRHLDESQRRAFVRIVHSLDDAIHSLDRHPRRLESSLFERSQHRRNQVMLLSGDRGTGKTCSLLSLERCCIRASEWDREISRLAEESPDRERDARYLDYQRLRNLIEGDSGLRRRVVWLDELEMDTLNSPTNLLAAILIRVQNIIERMGGEGAVASESRGILDVHPGYERAIMELLRLTSDVSLAWDGNMSERGAHLDPDVFAEEVMRGEKVRQEIPVRFARVLDEVARYVSWGGRVIDPLFVLPVDDFDLAPTRCLPLLRLIRMIEGPRLFTLLLGDIANIERVVHLRLVGDMAGVANVGLSAERLLETEFHRRMKGVAVSNLRKLIPPAQRIHLEVMTIQEVLDYRPYSAESHLHELLQLLQMPDIRVFPTPANRDVRRMYADAHAFLTESPISPKSGFKYSVLNDLSLAPREVVDFWYFAKHYSIAHGSVGALRRRFLADVYKQSVDNETNLDHSEKELLKSVFRVGETLQSLGMDTQAATVEFRGEMPEEIRGDGAELLRIQTNGQWRVGPPPRESRSRQVFLSRAATAFFVLTHDLIALHDQEHVARSLAPGPRSIPLATVVWETGAGAPVEITWPVAPFRSFWEWDHFIDAWRRANRQRRGLERVKPMRLEELTSHLAFAWIAAATTLHDGGKHVSIRPQQFDDDTQAALPSDETWDALVRRVGTMAGRMAAKRTYNPLTSWWLIHLALLLSPECGVSDRVADRFIPQSTKNASSSTSARTKRKKPRPKPETNTEAAREALRLFWMTPSVAKEIRRLRAETAAQFVGSGDPELAFWRERPDHPISKLADAILCPTKDDIDWAMQTIAHQK